MDAKAANELDLTGQTKLPVDALAMDGFGCRRDAQELGIHFGRQTTREQHRNLQLPLGHWAGRDRLQGRSNGSVVCSAARSGPGSNSPMILPPVRASQIPVRAEGVQSRLGTSAVSRPGAAVRGRPDSYSYAIIIDDILTMLYRLTRSALFLFPRSAHTLMLSAVRRLGEVTQPRPEAVSPVSAMGLFFANRVGLAAGFAKNATALQTRRCVNCFPPASA